MKYPRLLAASIAASLMLGLAAMPAAVQAAPAGDAKAKQSQSKKKLNRDIRKVRTRTTRAERRIRSLSRTINALNGIAGSNKKGLDFLLAAAPQLVNGLTQLRDGSLQLRAGLETVGGGLRTLANGVQNDIVPRLGAVEYGAVRLFQRPAASTAESDFVEVPGASANTSDIPDVGQGALASATIPFSATAATDISPRAAIRSNETDGAGGNPAGQVGGILYAKCASIPGVPATNCAGGAIDPGQIVCAPLGPPPGQDFGGSIGSQPLENIPDKQPLQDGFDRPNNDDINPTGDAANGDCTLPSSGLYEITFAVQFFDLPRSAGTPPPTE